MVNQELLLLSSLSKLFAGIENGVAFTACKS